ncbi:Hypothetical_protein [Hexamita inflata]|uniref:Hypothetical_protein n=1 Tax=Hexamita inflata TaxID=28002 RepID=A0AA86UDQ6_9EUKA|nr:Hypothetical protein HINF_LOCUS41775 [Hexamita inflata]CAI9963283.1 Hypothetical protein HINF_LOCUS50928 [Hexamita inflata]
MSVTNLLNSVLPSILLSVVSILVLKFTKYLSDNIIKQLTNYLLVAIIPIGIALNSSIQYPSNQDGRMYAIFTVLFLVQAVENITISFINAKLLKSKLSVKDLIKNQIILTSQMQLVFNSSYIAQKQVWSFQIFQNIICSLLLLVDYFYDQKANKLVEQSDNLVIAEEAQISEHQNSNSVQKKYTVLMIVSSVIGLIISLFKFDFKNKTFPLFVTNIFNVFTESTATIAIIISCYAVLQKKTLKQYVLSLTLIIIKQIVNPLIMNLVDKDIAKMMISPAGFLAIYFTDGFEIFIGWFVSIISWWIL